MKKRIKIFNLLLLVILLFVSVGMTVLAHSGRTDSSGGHKDNKNKSGLGYYHYHCGGYPAHLHDGGYCPYTDVMPSSVKISTEKSTLGIGESISISAIVYPSNACDTSVSWDNSNPEVVSLEDGKIKAIGYGSATISAMAINGRKSSITITVKEITANNVSIQETIDKMYIGDKINLSAIISPENVDNPTITWTSSDEEIATVEDGKVTAVAEGTVIITASANNGVSDSRTILVEEVVAEKIELKMNETMVHHSSDKIEVVFYPENTTFKEITWKNTAEDIVTVDEDGNVQALAVGNAIVIAEQKDTSAVIKIEVIPKAVEKIIISSTLEDALYVGDSIDFSARIIPEDATYLKIYWEVENEDIASIDKNGHLEAIGLGKTKVIASTEDGCKSSYEIKVDIPPLIITVGVGGTVGIIVAGIGIKFKKKKQNTKVVG